ncbi:MAG: nickel pincer cofactor biosynthesis protein LarC, partial [Acidimicrobiia bacterium]|nr:nickel pincer cofactor biosynthesis protein LarC [Acidimicrobiia bacterium]
MKASGSEHHHNLWLDPTFGASGDMILGALVGLGASLDKIRDGLSTLPIDGWTLTGSTVQRGSLSASRIEVVTDQSPHHRPWSSIDAMLASAALHPEVIDGARATFRALGQAEAAIHGVTIDEVHFHEVGSVDAIVDIVGAWLALDLLEVTTVTCGPIGLGHGTVSAAHGPLPLPAPATAALLQGAMIQPLDVEAETVTPTGAALLTTMASSFGPIPAGVLRSMARGAGGRNPEHHPNVVSAYLVESGGTEAGPGSGRNGVIVTPAVILQTNLDDVTGETVAHTIARCLELGAGDAWAHPIVMKKGRPGVELNVLASSSLVGTLRQVIFTETGSLGLRTLPVTKYAQPREFHTVDIDGFTVRI